MSSTTRPSTQPAMTSTGRGGPAPAGPASPAAPCWRPTCTSTWAPRRRWPSASWRPALPSDQPGEDVDHGPQRRRQYALVGRHGDALVGDVVLVGVGRLAVEIVAPEAGDVRSLQRGAEGGQLG